MTVELTVELTQNPGVSGTPGAAAGVEPAALLVAAARALETHRPDALTRDPYAEQLVRAAPAAAPWPRHPRDVPDGEADPLWGRLARYFALQTRAFDDQLLRAAQLGARQIVLLGAGLDTRGYRLDLPDDCTVYELDRPELLTFKQRVLDGTDARPTARRRTVGTDLRAVGTDPRADWAQPLTDAGFRPDRPTAWLAEGLLLRLPGAAESAVLAVVDRLSAPGSTLAYETRPGGGATPDPTGLGPTACPDPGPRPDSPADLTARGWSTTLHTPFEFTRHYGRGPLPVPDDALAGHRWAFAVRS
ncbi:SAM-dependent methyltransferase [Kitasatospora sp. NPDC089509]|uniref:SAM-dependent methyltransferase n=1 Tax=Kitasatospora sp. NPDC089509 TaxID=3364079 RepID=UPI0038074538